MENQTSFAQAKYAGKKRRTRRERFLADMEAVVPRARLVALITPFYPTGKRGCPPVGVEKMLRMYFLQHWYGLADEALEDALYDVISLRVFAGIDLGSQAVPDATTLLGFRHLRFPRFRGQAGRRAYRKNRQLCPKPTPPTTLLSAREPSIYS